MKILSYLGTYHTKIVHIVGVNENLNRGYHLYFFKKEYNTTIS